MQLKCEPHVRVKQFPQRRKEGKDDHYRNCELSSHLIFQSVFTTVRRASYCSVALWIFSVQLTTHSFVGGSNLIEGLGKTKRNDSIW